MKCALADLEKERLVRATREEEFSQHVEAEKVAGRACIDAEERVSKPWHQRRNRILEQRMQSKRKSLRRVGRVTRTAKGMGDQAQSQRRYGLWRLWQKLSILEQERIAMMDQTLEIKKEEDVAAHH